MSAPPKVLIVDDEALMGLIYQKHLEKAGYQLLTAGTAEQGLAMIQNEKPALIILDVILPAIDGLAALRKLKADEQTKAIPVIIITAATSQEHYATLREAMTCGAAAFLTKPFGPDKLVSEIKRLAPTAC